MELGVIAAVTAAPGVKAGGGIAAGGGQLHQSQGVLAGGQELGVFLVGDALQGDLKAQLLAPRLLEQAGQGGLTAAAVVEQRHRAQLLHGGGAGIAGLAQLRDGLGAAVVIGVGVVVDERTVDGTEVLTAGGADAVGDKAVGGRIARAHALRQGGAVHGQAEGVTQAVLLQVGGHLIDQQQAHGGVAAADSRVR